MCPMWDQILPIIVIVPITPYQCLHAKRIGTVDTQKPAFKIPACRCLAATANSHITTPALTMTAVTLISVVWKRNVFHMCAAALIAALYRASLTIAV